MLELEDVKFLTKLINRPMMSKLIKVGASLTGCSVLSSCTSHQDQKSSPENPGNPNDTITVTIPSGPSYFQAKHNFSK